MPAKQVGREHLIHENASHAFRRLHTQNAQGSRRRPVLFIGGDWVEGHHDVELQNETGRKPASARLPEGSEGIAKLHASSPATVARTWSPGR
ncbi:hypothetical protein [Kitasatospora sp. NPDC091276]|uniref:hypothetical protein n=1 Tax=Kitasatospora sp. NPDC091276 TaxID=3155300 RepID=UPI0034487BB8